MRFMAMAKAGVMLAGEGLHASAKGARIAFSGDTRTVIDGRRTSPPTSFRPRTPRGRRRCAWSGSARPRDRRLPP
jgi:hypothetical protein